MHGKGGDFPSFLLYSKRISDVLLSGVPILIKEDPIGFLHLSFQKRFRFFQPASCRMPAFSFVPETKQRQPPQAEGKKRKAGTGTEDFCGTATGPGIIQADLEKIGRQERRDAYLRMGIDRKNKLTFLWLTEEENTDRIWKENVLAQAGALAEKGSRAVVFISGHKDLFPLMEGLVKHNAGMLK